MSTIRVETPNKGFTGTRLGCQFVRGVAEVPADLANAFQSLGYTVRETQEQEAPARSKRTRTPRVRKTKEVSE